VSSPSLDIIQSNCNTVCGKFTVTGPDDSGQTTYVRLPCKTWACPKCGPKKVRRLQRAIAKTAQELDLTRFLTLTLDPKSIPEGVDQLKYLREVWRKFCVYLAREFGRTATYISVPEFHRSGVPHLHVLVDQYIRQQWISETWESLGGGRICYIKRVHDIHRVSHYVSKYFTKGMILSAPFGVRRYTTSRNIRLFERKQGKTGWFFARSSIESLRSALDYFVLDEQYEDGVLRSFTVSINYEWIPN